MGSKDGPHLNAGLRCGNGASAAGWSWCSSSTVWPDAKGEKRKPAPAARARKPKRTSFACLECSKTFPTQQAMAGHCSAHTRAGARRVPAPVRHANHLPAAAPVAVVAAPPNLLPQHHRNANAVRCWFPQVQVAPLPSTNPVPPLAVRYVPYARAAAASNQMMVRLPYHDLHGRRSSRRLATTGSATNPAFRRAAGTVPELPASGRLGWRAFVPIYSVPSCGVNGAPPGDAVSSTDRPEHTRAADLSLRLGLDSGTAHAQRKTRPLLESLMALDAHQQGAGLKCKMVITDGGDRGGNRGEDQNQTGGLDLELRLCR